MTTPEEAYAEEIAHRLTQAVANTRASAHAIGIDVPEPHRRIRLSIANATRDDAPSPDELEMAARIVGAPMASMFLPLTDAEIEAMDNAPDTIPLTDTTRDRILARAMLPDDLGAVAKLFIAARKRLDDALVIVSDLRDFRGQPWDVVDGMLTVWSGEPVPSKWTLAGGNTIRTHDDVTFARVFCTNCVGGVADFMLTTAGERP